MKVRQIVIEGKDGDVESSRVDDLARAVEVRVGPGTTGPRVVRKVLGESRTSDHEEYRYAAACVIAGVVYGTNSSGEPQCTNSMIHDVLGLLERVGG